MTFPPDMADRKTIKISMTITKESKKWVDSEYPEAQSTQEAIRMAIGDARKHCDSLKHADVHLDSD